MKRNSMKAGKKIVGRKEEQRKLNKVYQSREAEFVVVYGRRRVGKTYLIREFFKSKKCTIFHATGLKKGTMTKQLQRFSEVFSQTFFENIPLKAPKSWEEAFKLLHDQVIKQKEKTIIFLDELPWMATPKSGLLQEIDYYWNRYWSAMAHVILVVCGSSASWLIRKIIYDKGGLHNRLTMQIKLEPFTLAETNAFLKSKKITLNERSILSIYMALGGIPYYLNYVEPGLTAEANIQNICFGKKAPLYDEFNKLFQSLFKHAASYIEIVKLIASKRQGLSRSELDSLAKLSSTGGSLSDRLQELCDTGFIEAYTPWEKIKGEYYKLIDEFCLFHLYWIEPSKAKKVTSDYWSNIAERPSFYSWSGYAFEAVCYKHIEQIIDALNIRSAITVSSWRFVPRKVQVQGAQIDLLIDRTDNAITLCEIKYTKEPFSIDKEYANKIRQKITVFEQHTGVKKQLFFAMISAYGLKKTVYSEDMISGLVTLKDLFKEKE